MQPHDEHMRFKKHLFLLFLFSWVGWAEPTQSNCLQSLEKLNRLIDQHFFETRRDFYRYQEHFPQSFLLLLEKLDGSSHWLDAGSGEAFAIEDFLKPQVMDPVRTMDNAEPTYRRPARVVLDRKEIESIAERLNAKTNSEKPNITGVTFKMERPEPAVPKLKIKSGRFFEDIPVDEFKPTDLITDLYGIASYSPRVDEVLRRYHTLLKPGGQAYVFVGDYIETPFYRGILNIQRDGEPRWDSPFVESKVRKLNGEIVTLLDWMMDLPGFKSRLEFQTLQQKGMNGVEPGLRKRFTVILEKTAASAQVPILRLLVADDGKPPVRFFEEVSN